MLPEGFTLGERYTILRQTNAEGSSISYLARDNQALSTVTVREFFSDRLMSRNAAGQVTALPGREVQYKSLSSDYEELCRYLMTLDGAGGTLCPKTVLNTNGSVYSVEQPRDLQTLDDFLARNGGQIPWPQLKKAIAPIIVSIRRIHLDGYYHRGISPETVLVNRQGEFVLTGFDIPAARTADSEIESKLFFGFSAPEQYSSASWQGSWTDVYSIAAVCYRALTGTTPVEWRHRGVGRQLLPPRVIESTVPENVSNALMIALSVDIRNRYRSVEELWAGMLHGPGDTTVLSTIQVGGAQGRSTHFFSRRNLHAALMLVGIMLLVVLISINMVQLIIGPPDEDPAPPLSTSSAPASSSSANQPEPEVEALEIIVPDLTGISVERVMQNKMYTQLFEFEVHREFSESQPVGAVVRQTPSPLTKMEDKGALVTLYISMGSERTSMPQVLGMDIGHATAMLDERNILYRIEEIMDVATPAGTVIQTSVEYNQIIYRSRDTVLLTVAVQ